ncbi:hypothetical protein ACFV2Z_16385 [Streptomyces sp. NPDC059688]|uniref:hypothetical protein n=1 Tax=Streptomyces sp. NPDC059688 TaxID=3346906 RepID=UPI0036CB085E
MAFGEVRAPVRWGVGVGQGAGVGDPVGDLPAVVGPMGRVVGQTLAQAQLGVDLAGDGVGAGQCRARELPALGRGGAPGGEGAADGGRRGGARGGGVGGSLALVVLAGRVPPGEGAAQLGLAGEGGDQMPGCGRERGPAGLRVPHLRADPGELGSEFGAGEDPYLRRQPAGREDFDFDDDREMSRRLPRLAALFLGARP